MFACSIAVRYKHQQPSTETMPWGSGGLSTNRARGTHSSTCYVGKSGFGSTVRYSKNCPGCERQRAMMRPGRENKQFTVINIVKIFK